MNNIPNITIIETREAPVNNSIDDIEPGTFFYATSISRNRYLFFKSMEDTVVAITDDADVSEDLDSVFSDGVTGLEVVSVQITTVPVA